MSEEYESTYIRAFRRYAQKMSMEQYQEYKGNPVAQRILFQDCLEEEESEDRYSPIKLSEVKEI